MITRANLLDSLARLITEGAESKSADLALGREVVVPLNGKLAGTHPTLDELEALLTELPDGALEDGLSARVSWHGSRSANDLAIIVARRM